MQRLALLTAALVVVAAACDDSDTTTSGAGGGGASGPAGPGAGTVTGAGGSGSNTTTANGTGVTTGAGGGVDVLPYCKLSCSAASDCATATLLTDADNWSCTGGFCEYLGCQSTNECTATYMNPSYTCTTLPGLTIPTCNLTCTTAQSCATATLLTDADNWSCPSGICEYLGCQSTNECTTTYMSPNYTCSTLPGATIASCNPTCSTPENCSTATLLTDADNWSCPSGVCEYLGCQSTTECTATLMNASYVCD